MASSPTSSSSIDTILTSSSYYSILSLPPLPTPPSSIRKQYLKIARLVHPDKNDDKRAHECFQILSTAFEVLYDENSQSSYLKELKEEEEFIEEGKKRKKPDPSDWKSKKKPKNNIPEYKKWEDLERDLRTREALELQFLSSLSTASHDKRLRKLILKAQKITRNLDELAGCPEGWVNPIWSDLIENEILCEGLPEGWRKQYDSKRELCVFREIESGVVKDEHPDVGVWEKLKGVRERKGENLYDSKSVR